MPHTSKKKREERKTNPSEKQKCKRKIGLPAFPAELSERAIFQRPASNELSNLSLAEEAVLGSHWSHWSNTKSERERESKWDREKQREQREQTRANERERQRKCWKIRTSSIYTSERVWVRAISVTTKTIRGGIVACGRSHQSQKGV